VRERAQPMRSSRAAFTRRSRSPHERGPILPIPLPPEKRNVAPQLGRTVEDQNGGADPSHVPRGTGAGDRRRRLQHLSPPLRGRLHRPSDRLRHECHVGPPMGRDDAGRRGVCGLAQLLPAGRGGAPPLWIRAPDSDPPGAGGRASPVPHPDPSRRPHPGEHVLHDHPAASGTGRRNLSRCDHRRGPRPPVRTPLQGQCRSRQARSAGGERGYRTGALRLRGRHSQPGGGATDQPGQSAGGPSLDRGAWHPDHPRRHASGGERLVHPATRAGPGRPPGGRHPARSLRPGRRGHDVGEEGQPGEHRGMARAPGSGSGRGGAEPSGGLRGPAHLRGSGGPGHGSDGDRH